MQKKVLIPLLMAGTATVPALADINIGFPTSDKWAQSGTTGDQNPWSQSSGSSYEDTYTNVVGTGEVSTRIDLPKGSFRLSFRAYDSATATATENIKVFVDGVEVAPSADNSYAFEFEVQEAGTVAIVIRPAEENVKFSFIAQDLALIVNGNAIANALEQSLSGINNTGFNNVDYNDFYPDADELRTELDNLMNDAFFYEERVTYEDVFNEIRSLDYGVSLDYALGIYNKYQLYNLTNNAVQEKLNEVTERQTAYNDKVDAENAAWKNHEDNVAKHKELKKGQESLVSNDLESVVDCAQLKAEIDAWQVVDEAVKQPLYTALTAIEGRVVAYGEAIDAAFFAPDYADEALRTPIEFTSQEEALRAELTELQSQLKQGMSDYEVYYNVNFLLLKELEDVYENEYKSTVQYPETVTREKWYNDEVYKHLFTDGFVNPLILSESAAEKLLSDTKANCQIENVIGAAEYDKANGCSEQIKAAIAQLRDAKKNFENLVTTQDANMVTAQTQIKEFEERYALYEGFKTSLPADVTAEEYAAALETVSGQIADLKTYVQDAYDAHNLVITGYYSDYRSKVINIDDSFYELTNLAGPAATIADLQKMLDDARAKVVQFSAKEELVGLVDVASKFDGTFDALQDAINAIDTQEEADAAIRKDDPNSIAFQIEEAVWNANDMAYQFEHAKKYIGYFANGLTYADTHVIWGLEEFKTLVNGPLNPLTGERYTEQGKRIVNEAIEYAEGKSKTVTVPHVEQVRKTQSYRSYEIKIDEFNEKLTAAANAEGQESWKLIQELTPEIDAASAEEGMFGAAGMLFKAMADFDKRCTRYNKNYVDNLYYGDGGLIDKKTAAEEAMITGIEDVDFSDIEAAFTTAESIYATMTGLMYYADPFTFADNADEAYVNVLKAIFVQEDKINTLVDNQEAFAALTVKVQALEDALDGFRGYNETNSLTPGKEFFENKINEIDRKIDKLSVELATSVNEITAVAKTDEFNGKIAAINEEIQNELAADKANNSFHNAQLALEKEVRTYIENLIAKISANENQQDLALVKESLATLNDLLNSDLVLANQLMTGDYGNGQSAANNEVITVEYQRIKDEAIAVNDRYVNELQAAVEAANAETTAAWEMFMTELDNLYRDATRSYNYFAFELKNKGWRDCVSEAIGNYHDSLFAYAEAIATLKEEEAAAVNAWNTANYVIDPEIDWPVWVKKYEAMKKALNTEFDTMLGAMNNLAGTDQVQGYYHQEKAEAEAKLAESEFALTEAGIDTRYLDDAKEYLQEAEFEYWRGCKVDVQSDGDSDVSLEMDNIANVLDQVIPSIDLQAYAQDAWAKVYADAQATISNLREELEGYAFADPKVVEAQTKLFEENVSNAAGVNTKAVNDKELVKNFKADCEELQGYLDNIEEAVTAVKESNDLNVENMNIYGDFINWSKEVDADLAALREYCEAMAGCFGKLGMVDALQSQLDALKKDVEQNKATLVNEDIPGRMAAFDAAVLASYAEAAAAEKAYLSDRVDEATDAFAEAYRNQGKLPEGETFEELNADIRDIDAAVDAMVFDEADKDAFKDEAVKYEKELADIYTMLQSSWTENPTAAVLAALEGRYAAINAEIEAGINYLANCMDEVKAKYPDAYKAYQDALNAERAEWQGEGTYVIDREPFHNRVLDEIQNQVKTLAAQITADEQAAQAEAEKIRVSEARYEVLKAQYDGLVAEFEAAKATVDGYGNDIAKNLTIQANRIQGMLDQALKDLNTQRASHSLTNNSQLTNGQAIDTAIDAYVLSGANQLAGIKLNEATQAGNKAMYALTSHSMVPAERIALTAEYKTANTKLQSLLDEKNHANADRLAEIAEEAEALVETFNSIAERAQESYFVLGNVNMDEDGEVNAVDVQALINLIGEGETYETLYAANPRQACAADVAGNKVLDIADVTALIQLIMGDEPQILKVRARIPGVAGDDHLTIAFMGEEDGVRRYALSLTNTTEFIGAQFDIKASGNARIVGMQTAERTANHEVYMFENIDGARAVMASMANAVFTGNDGVVMYVDVEGKGELTVEKAAFADKDNVTHLLDKAHTSSIDAIIDGFKDGASRIYDAAGRAYNRLQKGINIIRHKDGTVTKEMHK